MVSLKSSEIIPAYRSTVKNKTSRPPLSTLLLAVLGGMFIAFGCAATNTATHSIANKGVSQLIAGLIFPFGLAMVMVLGTELYTGNCMFPVFVWDKSITLTQMLRNWLLVYGGNFIGALILAAGCVVSGQLHYSNGHLAAHTLQVAVSKCSLTFSEGIIRGVFCNILVCTAVLCSLSAKDTTGKILGAYVPVTFFIICGFEHSVANMFYISAGLFALQVPEYSALAASMGIDTSPLTVGNFLGKNLLPVTLGNILGGIAVGAILWYASQNKTKEVLSK